MWREEGRSREWEGWKKRREDERGRREEWEGGLDMGGLRESPCSVRAHGRGGCPQHGGREGRSEEERRGKCCEGGGGGAPRRREERECSLHGGSHRVSNVTGSSQVSNERYKRPVL